MCPRPSATRSATPLLIKPSASQSVGAHWPPASTHSGVWGTSPFVHLRQSPPGPAGPQIYWSNVTTQLIRSQTKWSAESLTFSSKELSQWHWLICANGEKSPISTQIAGMQWWQHWAHPGQAHVAESFLAADQHALSGSQLSGSSGSRSSLIEGSKGMPVRTASGRTQGPLQPSKQPLS